MLRVGYRKLHSFFKLEDQQEGKPTQTVYQMISVSDELVVREEDLYKGIMCSDTLESGPHPPPKPDLQCLPISVV